MAADLKANSYWHHEIKLGDGCHGVGLASMHVETSLGLACFLGYSLGFRDTSCKWQCQETCKQRIPFIASAITIIVAISTVIASRSPISIIPVPEKQNWKLAQGCMALRVLTATPKTYGGTEWEMQNTACIAIVVGWCCSRFSKSACAFMCRS